MLWHVWEDSESSRKAPEAQRFQHVIGRAATGKAWPHLGVETFYGGSKACLEGINCLFEGIPPVKDPPHEGHLHTCRHAHLEQCHEKDPRTCRAVMLAHPPHVVVQECVHLRLPRPWVWHNSPQDLVPSHLDLHPCLGRNLDSD
eukprot:15433723-Alexandrium_andersonii.AAC.1